MTGDLLFSVVVPVRNGERWVAEALDSALAQGRGDFEVIVVDDGSTDRTPAILASYTDRITVIRQDSAGVSAARNRAIAQARGEWIAFLDADDRWRPGHLDRLAAAIKSHPQAGLISTDAMTIDANGRGLKLKSADPPGGNPFMTLLMRNRITTSAAAVRRSCLDHTGLFLPGLKSGEDWDLWLRLAREFPVVHVPQTSVDYRKLSGATVLTRGLAMRDDNLLVIARARKFAPATPPSILRKAIANAYRESAIRMLDAGETRAARSELASALKYQPLSPDAWAMFLLAALGPKAVAAAKSVGRRRTIVVQASRLLLSEGAGETPASQPQSRIRPTRIRIAHLITDSGAGGAEKILYRVATGLDPSHYECRVIALKPPGITARRLAEAGIPVASLGLPATAGVGTMLALPFAFLRLAVLLICFKPHVLHCWLFQANIMGRAAARVVGAPVNVSGLRVLECEREFQYPLDRMTRGLVTRYAAVCEAVAEHYRARLGLAPDRITVIPNGIDPGPWQVADRSALRRDLGIPSDALVIGGLGRLHRQKGFDLLIAALPRLIADFPGLILLLAGDGPERQNLEAQAHALGLGGSVRFLGAWTRVPEFMAALDVFALPSRWEGMPNALLEAFAANIPVIASDVGGVREILGPTDTTGIAVRPNDIDALSSALSTLLTNPSLRSSLSSSARLRLQSDFSEDLMLHRYHDFYTNLLLDYSRHCRHR